MFLFPVSIKFINREKILDSKLTPTSLLAIMSLRKSIEGILIVVSMRWKLQGPKKRSVYPIFEIFKILQEQLQMTIIQRAHNSIKVVNSNHTAIRFIISKLGF